MSFKIFMLVPLIPSVKKRANFQTHVLFGTTTFYPPVVPPVMDPPPTVSLSLGDQKRLNNGKRRKINVNKWKDKKRKESRNAGQPYISKTKKPVPGKLPPREVSRITF